MLVGLRGAGQTEYLGPGGLLGVVSAATGHPAPDSVRAWGVGNALGNGPVLLWLPPRLVSQAAHLNLASSDLAVLEVQLFRYPPPPASGLPFWDLSHEEGCLPFSAPGHQTTLRVLMCTGDRRLDVVLHAGALGNCGIPSFDGQCCCFIFEKRQCS